MTKTQKIWLGIFIAMFAVPEILWSPVGNFIYSVFFGVDSQRFLRPNYLIVASNKGSLMGVLLVQFFGLLESIIVIAKKQNKSFTKFCLLILLILLLASNFIVLYLVWATNHIGS